MSLKKGSALVTGGASGLGLATAKRLINEGCQVVIVDINEAGCAEAVAKLGSNARSVVADVSDPIGIQKACDLAQSMAPLRILVHCAGVGGPVRVVDKEGNPGSLERYEAIIRTNLIGSFNVLRLAAATMAKNELVGEERGVCILTASIAAYEGQIGQVPYASAKAGVVGMTLVAARDLASRSIRVCTIAPGVFDTPILAKLPEEIKTSLGKAVPHPARLGQVDEFASLADHIINNPMLNGETIRLDGATRMGPR